MFPRVALLLSSLLFAAAGLAFLLAPASMAAQVDLLAGSPTALTDIRAIYGGLELGLACYLGLLLRRSERDPAQLELGLRAAIFALMGMALARLLGVALDGPQRAITWLLWSGELVGALLCGIGLRALARAR